MMLRHGAEGVVRLAREDAAVHQVAHLGAIVGDGDRLALGDTGQGHRHRIRRRRRVDIVLGQCRMDQRHRRLAAGAEAEFGGADEHRHVAVRVLVVVHQLMRHRQLIVDKGP
jgi:hypothetical protein